MIKHRMRELLQTSPFDEKVKEEILNGLSIIENEVWYYSKELPIMDRSRVQLNWFWLCRSLYQYIDNHLHHRFTSDIPIYRYRQEILTTIQKYGGNPKVLMEMHFLLLDIKKGLQEV